MCKETTKTSVITKRACSHAYKTKKAKRIAEMMRDGDTRECRHQHAKMKWVATGYNRLQLLVTTAVQAISQPNPLNDQLPAITAWCGKKFQAEPHVMGTTKPVGSANFISTWRGCSLDIVQTFGKIKYSRTEWIPAKPLTIFKYKYKNIKSWYH